MINPSVISGQIGRVLLAALFLTVGSGLPFSRMADGADVGVWTLSSVEGAVAIDGQPVRAAGAQVAPGAVLETGDDGKAVLTRPGDSIAIHPGSRMAIPAARDGGEPGIVQTLGRLLFRMESRESRDFEIRTPYLAAAIKGTTFAVEVEDDEAEVEVAEGSVLVTANRSGHSVYVGAGQRASVGGGRGDSVRVSRSRDDDDDDDDDDDEEREDREEDEREDSEKDERESSGESDRGDDSADSSDSEKDD